MTPTADDIRASVVEYLVKTARVPAHLLASGNVRLADLNVDSLSAVEMLWTVESTYHVRLPDLRDGLSTMSLDDLVEHFRAVIAGSGAGVGAETFLPSGVS